MQIGAFVHKTPAVTETMHALDVLAAIRSSPVHIALVFDEYGSFEGVISTGDILKTVIGFNDHNDEPAFSRREDGSLLVSGWMPVDEFADLLGYPIDPEPEFETVAGLVLDQLGHIPSEGEYFSRHGWRFEVLDLDGRRIDKLLVSRIAS